MNEITLREKLWDKVSKEFDDFKKEQLNESKETIFENAFKISTLNDFVDMCDPDCGCLNIDEVKALLKENTALCDELEEKVREHYGIGIKKDK